jgi:hypothetical protein
MHLAPLIGPQLLDPGVPCSTPKLGNIKLLERREVPFGRTTRMPLARGLDRSGYLSSAKLAGLGNEGHVHLSIRISNVLDSACETS